MNAFTVRQLAERYGVSEDTVTCWIKSGELRALNCGRSPAKKKPRWKILPAAVEAFELSRTVTPPPVPVRRRKRSAEIVEYIK